jgi:hypothetical protein
MKAMRLPFLKQSATSREPLVVAMTGVRLGDSVLFAGRSPALLLPIAARTGLSGRCLAVGPPDDVRRLEAVAMKAGVLIETATVFPADGTFDLAVVEATGDWSSVAGAARSSVRSGGRIMAIAGEQRAGLLSRWTSSPAPVDADAIVRVLSSSGWLRARAVGERDGLHFVEAFA